MNKNINTPIVNLAVYRLDIYRLLTLLLADKQIADNAMFKYLRIDNFDNEVNRLLILVSVITRQLLDNTDSALHKRECGNFWHNYQIANIVKLKFKQACSMVIHATDIVIKSPDYYHRDQGEDGERENTTKAEPESYFQGKIVVIGQKKERADIDLQQFAQYCIMLSDDMTKGD